MEAPPCFGEHRVEKGAPDARLGAIGIDGEFVQPEQVLPVARDREADGTVRAVTGHEGGAAGDEIAELRGGPRRFGGNLRIAVIREEGCRPRLDCTKQIGIAGLEPPDADVAGKRSPQPSQPSTMTISASATVTRIAFAAWYSGEL